MDEEEEEERLRYIKDVTQRYVVCCTMLETAQGAHFNMLKTKQQALQLSFIPIELTKKLEATTQDQVTLLHMLADQKVQLERCLQFAQRELLAPIVYPQPISPNSDGTDEALRDVRANVFPNSE